MLLLFLLAAAKGRQTRRRRRQQQQRGRRQRGGAGGERVVEANANGRPSKRALLLRHVVMAREVREMRKKGERPKARACCRATHIQTYNTCVHSNKPELK